MNTTTVLKRLRGLKADDGQALVEFAMCLPLMLVLLAAIVDYGLYIQAAIQVQDAAMSGASYGAMPGNQTNTSGMQFWATYSASNSYTPVTNFSANATDIFTCTPGGATVSYNATCTGYGTPIEYVQVRTSGKFSAILGYPGIPANITVYGLAMYRVPWTEP